MSMRWSLYAVATYSHGSRQGVRSGHPSIGTLLGALAFSQPSDLAERGARRSGVEARARERHTFGAASLNFFQAEAVSSGAARAARR